MHFNKPLLLSFICFSVVFGPARADRYDDLMAKWSSSYASRTIGSCTSTDAMRLAWNCMGAFHGHCYAYDVTKNKVIADRLYECLNNNVVGATRTNAEGNTAYLYSDGGEEPGETFRIIEGILHWVYLVKENTALHADYLATANTYLAKVEDQLISWWTGDYFIGDAQDPDAPQDYHYPGSGMIVNPIHSGNRMSSPNNKLSDFGVAMCYLYKITKKQAYLDIIRQAALRFKSVVVWQNGGEYYSWHYFDPFWKYDFENLQLGGLARHGTWIEHRGGYGAINMKFMAEAYRLGLVYCREDINRFVRTNRDVMYNPGGAWLLNDGSVPPTDWYGSLYPALCPYDSTGTLADIGYNSYNNDMGSWDSRCNAPYYIYAMKLAAGELHPPDTLGWIGPLEAIKVEPINKSYVKITFFNEVDPNTLTDLANFDFSRGIGTVAATIDASNARIVHVYTTEQTAGVTMKLRIRNVKDIYGNVTFAYGLSNQPYLFTASSVDAGISDPGFTFPTAAFHLRASPNPAWGPVRISYIANTGEQNAIVRVLDQQGRLVCEKVNTKQHPGENIIWWESKTGSGLYYINVNNDVKKLTMPLMLFE